MDCPEIGAFSPADRPKGPETPKCGKIVKLFAYGTKVLSHIQNHFRHNTFKEFWPIFRLDLVS
jgi:hypothetical protein